MCNPHAAAQSGGADQQCTQRLKTDDQPDSGRVRYVCLPKRCCSYALVVAAVLLAAAYAYAVTSYPGI